MPEETFPVAPVIRIVFAMFISPLNGVIYLDVKTIYLEAKIKASYIWIRVEKSQRVG